MYGHSLCNHIKTHILYTCSHTMYTIGISYVINLYIHSTRLCMYGIFTHYLIGNVYSSLTLDIGPICHILHFHLGAIYLTRKLF